MASPSQHIVRETLPVVYFITVQYGTSEQFYFERRPIVTMKTLKDKMLQTYKKLSYCRRSLRLEGHASQGH